MIGVTIITKAPHLARSLWDRGWPATSQSGRAENGPVTILSVPVNRRDEARLHRDVQSIAPDAVWTTRDLRAPNSADQPNLPKRLHARYGIGTPLRRYRGQVPKEDGTADERILARV
jgi:hypothetical protein